MSATTVVGGSIDDDRCNHIGTLFDFAGDNGIQSASASPAKPAVAITIQSFPSSYVRAHDHELFNTNNHHDMQVDPTNPLRLIRRPDGLRRRVDDYQDRLDMCATRLWIDLFHTHYRIVNIPRVHLGWMKTASVVACQKEGMSPAFVEDVEDAVKSIATGDTFSRCERGVATSGYFVRTDAVSLKDGVHGVGPYYGLKEILESSITARMGHQGVDGCTQSLKYYLLPWQETLHSFREFRVFVYNRQVTGISQQCLYDAHPLLSRLPSPEHVRHVVENWCSRLLPYIETVVLSRITWMGDFVMDIVLLGPPLPPAFMSTNKNNNSSGRDAALVSAEDVENTLVDYKDPSQLTPYFIEINPFGYEYSSGSSLFSWVDDYAVLYGLAAAAAAQDVSDSATATDTKDEVVDGRDAGCAQRPRRRVIPFRFTSAPTT